MHESVCVCVFWVLQPLDPQQIKLLKNELTMYIELTHSFMYCPILHVERLII